MGGKSPQFVHYP